MPRRAQIVGWGMYLPSRIVTNDELAALVDTSDEWIRQRTGIGERRIAEENETTAEMAVHAAQQALRMSAADPSELGLIIVATATPDHAFPSVACLVQEALGATHAGAFDLSAACSGFVYALAMANDAIRAGTAQQALVIGVEKLSRVIDWTDRNTCVLFGDGAGAILLRAGDGEAGILATTLGSDGSGAEALVVRRKAGAPLGEDGPFVHMDGRRVFRFASRVFSVSVQRILRDASERIENLDLIIPHQANQRIIEQACQRLKFPQEKVVTNLDRYGNTSAASVPIALCEAAEEGRLEEGALIALVAFGGGLTWAAALLRWGHVEKPVWHRALRGRLAQYWGAILHAWHTLRERVLAISGKASRQSRRSRRRFSVQRLRLIRRVRRASELREDPSSETPSEDPPDDVVQA